MALDYEKSIKEAEKQIENIINEFIKFKRIIQVIF